mmetsp:Transcript_6598/g.8037  ORF Transcript_6598/g.8037 Transcript_6598/m.8037 type:complete len:85 (-) Transcript_6598:705-959(-)
MILQIIGPQEDEAIRSFPPSLAKSHPPSRIFWIVSPDLSRCSSPTANWKLFYSSRPEEFPLRRTQIPCTHVLPQFSKSLLFPNT